VDKGYTREVREEGGKTELGPAATLLMFPELVGSHTLTWTE
jgi:hypothetical protein